MRHVRRPRGWRLHERVIASWAPILTMITAYGIVSGTIIGVFMGLVLAPGSDDPAYTFVMTIGRAIVFAIVAIMLIIAVQLMRK